MGEFVASPLVVSCEIDVLPAERGEEFEQFGVDSEAAASRSSDDHCVQAPRMTICAQAGVDVEFEGAIGEKRERLRELPAGGEPACRLVR